MASSSATSRPSLPIMKMKNVIVDKIQMNRVTLIVGETGCGTNVIVKPIFISHFRHAVLKFDQMKRRAYSIILKDASDLLDSILACY